MLRFDPMVVGMVDLGLLPQMLSESDPRPAAEQLDTGYAYGGGWRPFQGFELVGTNSLKYPGDPAMQPLAVAHLREEKIYLYPHAWVAVFQKDNTFEVCRMD